MQGADLSENKIQFGVVYVRFGSFFFPPLQIERIQNPRMWKNYQNNKQYMEQRNGHQNNETMLFHGTREDTISHINQNGFNRSYAGKNGMTTSTQLHVF